MKTLARFAFLALALTSSSIALGDEPLPRKPDTESPKPIVGKAPTDAPPKDADAKVEKIAGSIFDVGDFEQPDKATDALLKGVDEKCSSDPRSREGMNVQQARRCDAAVTRLVQHGPKSIAAIFQKLQSDDDVEHYYARTRLYYALGKMNDPKVEDVLLRGYARVASKELDAYANDIFMIESALVTLNGVNPVGADAIGQPDVSDQWQAAQAHVMSWRVFQRDHAGKSKATLKSEELARARADKSSKDLKKAALALSTLAELAPNEALKGVAAFTDSDDVSPDDKSVFFGIESRALENGGVDAPEVEALPVKTKPAKSKTRMKKRL